MQSSKAALGEDLYRALTEDGFEIDATMSALGITDERTAARAASNLEAAIHLWQRKNSKRGQVRERGVEPVWLKETECIALCF